MKRVFEMELPFAIIERITINGDEITQQFVFNQTSEEFEKTTCVKVNREAHKATGGEIKGVVFKEHKGTLKGWGWVNANDYIKNRLERFKEIKEGL